MPLIGHPPRLNRISVRSFVGAPESGVVGRRRLDTAYVIGTPRLEHGLSTVPRPGELKAGEGDSKRRLREVRVVPGPTAVGGDFKPAHSTAPGPRETFDRVKAAAGQPLSGGREGDDRFRSLRRGIRALVVLALYV